MFMRLMSVATAGIGGLYDGVLSLPPSPVAALAGANGTGKSKLLACLLSPWTGVIPSAQTGSEAEVAVRLRVTEQERQALGDMSRAVGWGDIPVPLEFDVITRHTPLAGIQYTSEPAATVLAQFGRQATLLKAQPSLDVLFLPAERRLLPANSTGIDLNQLSEDLAQQMSVSARGTVQSYGRLDDAEFEQFAKALCVAGQLQDDPSDPEDATAIERPRIEWNAFADTVNSLIAPKRLLPLTKRHPESLRIATPDGFQHAVQDLSSGERQALIIISRILRAGSGHSVVMIDEPDAYLHPHLSRRLALALEQAVGPAGQLVVATHSPAVLDTISPSSIVRLSHTHAPTLVTDESERLEVYRDAGFRASSLTQSDLLVITEGDTDTALLPLLLPDLARATMRGAGGARCGVGRRRTTPTIRAAGPWGGRWRRAAAQRPRDSRGLDYGLGGWGHGRRVSIGRCRPHRDAGSRTSQAAVHLSRRPPFAARSTASGTGGECRGRGGSEVATLPPERDLADP